MTDLPAPIGKVTVLTKAEQRGIPVADGVTRLAHRSQYMRRLLNGASQLNSYTIGRRWYDLVVHIDDAIAWADLGLLPEEATPLIAQGITPAMVDAMEDAEVAADGGQDAHLRAAVLRLAEDHGLIIDPELADRLGLD